MQLKSLLIHIALLPVYITVASFLGLIPESYNLASLTTRLARTNLPRFFNQTIPSANLATTSTNKTMAVFMKFVPRPSHERGQADHGWLKTFHTFSFAMYQDWDHEHFGPLRVINEDRVSPRTGFGTHSHREFEIFSYIVKGELEQ